MSVSLLRGTVWAEGALADEPKKYWPLKRLWLPLYDVVAVLAGVSAVANGSTILNRIYGSWVDVIGVVLILVSLICFLGVAYPALWLIETAGKSMLVGMVGAYAFMVVFFSRGGYDLVELNLFVGLVLLFGLPLALFRLDMLSRERFDRKVKERVHELAQ